MLYIYVNLRKGRGVIINDTRIKYLSVAGSKLYKVTDIDFWNLAVEAVECDLDVGDVPEEELFCLEDFGEFKVILCNGCGKIVDLGEWRKWHGKS